MRVVLNLELDFDSRKRIHPRKLVLDATPGPELKLPSEGGAPAVLRSPTQKETEAEAARASALLGGKAVGRIAADPGVALKTFLRGLGADLADSGDAPVPLRKPFDPRELIDVVRQIAQPAPPS